MKKTVAIIISLIILITGLTNPVSSLAEETQNEIEYTTVSPDMFKKVSINSSRLLLAQYNEAKGNEENGCKVHSYRLRIVQKAGFDCTGLVKKTCSVCGKEELVKTPRIKKVYLEKDKYKYTGAYIKPKVIIKDENGKNVSGSFYAIHYYNNKRAGIARAEVTFIGQYKGSKTLNFVIASKNSASPSKAVNTASAEVDNWFTKLKNGLINAIRNNGPVLSALGDHLYGATTAVNFSLIASGTNTNYGYGTRIKNPKSPITKIYLKTMVTEECELTCAVASADLKTVHYLTKTRVSPSDTECCFKFSSSFIIENEREIYILVYADKPVMCEGMTTMKAAGTLNSEIGAANAKASKCGNVYTEDGSVWKYRTTLRTDEKNMFGLCLYVYCRNDYFNVKHNTLYVSQNGSDESGDGSVNNPYATLYYANSVITDNSYFNRYTIKVADGEYNELSTLKDSDLTRAILCKNYVSYEGNTEHPENCVIYYDGSKRDYGAVCTYSKVQSKAIFEICGGCRPGRLGITTSVKGFKLVGRNLRYVIHLDTAGNGIGADWEFSNLIINFQGNPDCVNDNAKHYAVGCGLAQFEKCVWNSITFTGSQKTYSGTEYNHIYYAHNNVHNQPIEQGGLIPCETIFNNCDLGGGRIVLASLSENEVNIRFNNCSDTGVITNSSSFDKEYINVYTS